ncbi:MAG: hypothetical protein AAF551_14895, partial [Bacteroidota bacterium]
MKFQLLVICVLFASCTPRVVHFLNSNVSYQDLNTYRLVNVKVNKRNLSREAAQLLDLIESSIQFQMSDKRMYEVSNVSPDLILRYEFISNTNSQVTQNTGFFQFPSTNIQTVYESVILLELLHDKKLVWQGSYDMRQSRRTEKSSKN